MSEIERVTRYIEHTRMEKERYTLSYREIFEMTKMTAVQPVDAVILAFEYGKAKGYRAAKAEVKRGQAN